MEINSKSVDDVHKQYKINIIYTFLEEFMQFERLTKLLFESTVDKIEQVDRNEFYFYYGGLIGTFFSYDAEEIEPKKPKYSPNITFNDLYLMQILKISKKNGHITCFDFDIRSISKKHVRFPFLDCAIKLVDMRNKIAHDLKKLEITEEKHLIELLGCDVLKKVSIGSIKSCDSEKMDENISFVASNIVYMRIMTKKLERKLKIIDPKYQC